MHTISFFVDQGFFSETKRNLGTPELHFEYFLQRIFKKALIRLYKKCIKKCFQAVGIFLQLPEALKIAIWEPLSYISSIFNGKHKRKLL